MDADRESTGRQLPPRSGQVSPLFVQLLGKYGASPRLLHKIKEVTEDRPDANVGLSAGAYRARRSSGRLGVTLSRIAGADSDLLESLPGERIRYQALGATVLLSAVTSTVLVTMVVATMGFDIIGASVLGVVWGAMVSSLSRWLVMVPVERRSRLVWLAIPHLVVSLLQGVMLSEPLTLAIFRPAIDAYIAAHPDLLNQPYGVLSHLQALSQLAAEQPVIQLGRWALLVLISVLYSAPIFAMLALRWRVGAYAATVALKEQFSPVKWGLDNMREQVRRHAIKGGAEPESDSARELAAMATRIEMLAAEVSRAKEENAEIIDLATRQRRVG